MTKKNFKNNVFLRYKVSNTVHFYGVIRLFIVFGILGLGWSGFNQQVHADEKKDKQIAAYCEQQKYKKDTPEFQSCVAGANLRSDTCAAYGTLRLDLDGADVFPGQKLKDICDSSLKEWKAKGSTPSESTQETTNSNSTTSPSPSTKPDWKKEIDALNEKLQKNTEGINKTIDNLQKLQEKADSKQVGEKCDKEPSDISKFYSNGRCQDQRFYNLNPDHAPGSPVILFFNGGGWHGNDCMGAHVSTEFAENCDGPPGLYKLGDEAGFNKLATRGYAMYDVTYRYGSSGVYYQLEDVLRAIRHFRENAGRLGIDPSKIIIWGDSAGGSLVMRAAATGSSGARVAIGWSAPTNGYTALFHSFQSLAIAMDHTTCVPTDLAGFANFFDLATGGKGAVAKYGEGITSNDFSALGLTPGGTGEIDVFDLFSQGLKGLGNASTVAVGFETITQQIMNKDGKGLSVSVMNIASKKFVECLDNFNAMSPALFANPDTPPSFLAGFDNDGVVGPEQAYGMRDKLQQLGIKSEALIRPGDETCAEKTPGPAFSGGCHLGYYWAFVCPSIRFIESVIQPDSVINCETGAIANNNVATNSNGASGSNANGSSGTSGANSNGASGSNANGSSGTSGANSNGASGSNYSAGGNICDNYISDGRQDLTERRAACESGNAQYIECYARGSDYRWYQFPRTGGYCGREGAGDFNEGIKIDTSRVTVSY